MTVGDGIAIAGIALAIGIYNAFSLEALVDEIGEWRQLIEHRWFEDEKEENK